MLKGRDPRADISMKCKAMIIQCTIGILLATPAEKNHYPVSVGGFPVPVCGR